MNELTALASIAAIHLAATMSPGPAFLTVAQASLSASRSQAFATALGVATAAIIWAAAALLGLHLLIQKAFWLYVTLKVAGGLYLIWLGIAMWRGARTPLRTSGQPAHAGPLKAWAHGLAANLTNPKEMIFFGSVFVTLFSPSSTTWLYAAAFAVVVTNECAWYALVAAAFSSARVRAGYARIKAWVDRICGMLMMLFGARLIYAARS